MNTLFFTIRGYVVRLIKFIRRKARLILYPVYVPVRRVAQFLDWVFPTLGELLAAKSLRKRRLLLIYDTSSQPYGLGDVLVIQEASLVLRQKYNLGEVDFALVYNPDRPAPPDTAFDGINADNAKYHLASILPVAQANQYLGSLFVFDSHSQLHRYISDNTDLYLVWPTAWKYATKEYVHYTIFNDLLRNHYKEHGSIPYLTCHKFLVDWAERFYREHAPSLVPVTVNIRNNKNHQLSRNATIDSWLALFEHCETRYPAKFIVICARSEIDERFRKFSNVLIVKDFHSGIEEDLALIHTSAMHMGVGSGPASMAWFNSKPYLMANTTYGPDYFAHSDMIIQEEKNIQRFWFANPLQRIANGAETADMLIKEFARMWNGIDVGRWQLQDSEAISEADVVTKTWLR